MRLALLLALAVLAAPLAPAESEPVALALSWSGAQVAVPSFLAAEPGDTRTILGAAPDGVIWRVTYFPSRYVSDAEADRHAQMHLDAALDVYAIETAWGFESRDPDRILDITLLGCACIAFDEHARIFMFPRGNDTLDLAPGIAYESEEAFVRVILAHELFHHMQFGIQTWKLGPWVVEGMARFVETVAAPQAAHAPTTITYLGEWSGMNGFPDRPSEPLSRRAYDAALLWGYLYAHDGGMPLLRAILEESASLPGDEDNDGFEDADPDVDGPIVIDRALSRFPEREHATFRDAYLDFAAAVATRSDLSWAGRDWALYLREPIRAEETGVLELAPWALRFHDLSEGALLHVEDATIDAFRVGEAAGPAPLLLAGRDDAALLFVRAHPPQERAGAYLVERTT